MIWNDIDVYRDHNIFSYNNESFYGLPEFIDMLHNDGLYYIPMLDPGVGGNYYKLIYFKGCLHLYF